MKDINGHTLAELATLRANGATWKDVAVEFHLRPRAGADDALMAAHYFWQAAGEPGKPPKPPGSPGPERNEPEWVEWWRQRDEVLDAWLREQAG